MTCRAQKIDPTTKLRSCHTKGVTLTEEIFDVFRIQGKPTEKTVKKFTWSNKNHMQVEMINYGATITSIKFLDKHGNVDDLVLGFDSVREYQKKGNPYMGATIGRVSNRISNATMTINGEKFNLSNNNPPFCFHGGHVGFDKVLWDYYLNKKDKIVIMSYYSPEGSEGFPGDVNAYAICYLTDGNEFVLEYRAVSTKPTYLDLSNHTFFNLAGEDGGSKELLEHTFCINADKVTDTDRHRMPNGKFIYVGGTLYDFRISKTLENIIDRIPGYPYGFDHNFCVTKSKYQENSFVAKVVHPPSGRILEIYSNQPGVHFYIAGDFPDPKKSNENLSRPDITEKSKSSELRQGLSKNKLKSLSNIQMIVGKQGKNYYRYAGFTLRTQNYPNAINVDGFPKQILYPGQVYTHTIKYIFSVNNQSP